MDTLASVAILFCVVTVHQQVHQSSDSMQAHILQMTVQRQKKQTHQMTAQKQNKQIHRADATASPKPFCLSGCLS